MNYKEVIESRYNRQNWQLLLHDIFGNKIKFWNTPSTIPTSSQFAKQALWLGTITLSDNQTISIYEVELSDSVDIERNRRGIRDMLLTDWRNNGNAGAFMFCYRKNESVLRFSYVSEAWTFADDGSYQKESTDAKRFTYLLGEGHRSRTAIQQFEKLRDSSLTLKDLTKAFSVDAVSDMFFDGYKKQYEDIIQYITGKRMVKVANKWEEQIKNDPCKEIMQEFAHFPNPEKAVRDYVKKLMGRLVFLQFLQKKGWLGVPAGAEWGAGDAEFIQNLFAECEDKDHFVDNVLEVLFNDLNTEREGNLSPLTSHHSPLKIPYLNGGLFERDATDETEFPLPAKYMQSLLDFFASYNFTIDENDPDDAEVGVDPEMLGRIFENLLEDNKDKGAFYTPKEIVSYMCRESLIAYLQTDIEDEATKEAIRQFVTSHDINTLGTNDKFHQQVDEALKNVKICDPAIGSGAFPMGLLKELFQCRTALEGITQSKAAEIKKHIIQQNIYGVDIERGAVDIARLRFWLSLIVDEETPQALPNLDFKIMQGNSLLEQYKGVDLSTMTDAKWKANESLSIFDNMLDVYRRDMRIMISQYYDCTNHDQKQSLKKQILENVKDQLIEQHINPKDIDINLSENNQFFLWHTWFFDVFSLGGFDIVIGNPPYVSSKAIPVKDKQTYKNVYTTAVKQFDLYSLFIEQACNMLKTGGITSYIIPDSFIGRSNFEAGRRIVVIDRTVLRWEHINNVFESADVSSLIYVIRNNNKKSNDYTFEYHKSRTVKEWASKDYLCQIISKSEIESSENLKIVFASDDENYLMKKIKTGRTFDEIFVMWRGEEIGRKSDSVLGFAATNSKVLYTGKQVRRYSSIDPVNWIRVPDVQKSLLLYDKDKILIRQLGDCINATINTNGGIITQSVYALVLKENQTKPLEYYLGLLNSTLFKFIYKIIAGDKQLFKRIILENIKKLPLPTTDGHVEEIKDLVSRVIELLCINPSAETSALESEIDSLVYQLYGLTEEEIKIVEQS